MSTARMRVIFPVLAIFLLLWPAGLRAQTGAASITGLIVDQSGAALPGVTVTATNQATNVAYVATTNSSGNYTIPNVVLGTYVVKAELTGFRASATEPLTVEARQVARVDLKLAVGAIAETVNVVTVSPILQTETSTVGEVLSGTTVQSLPLNGRNTSQLALLLPGTVTYNPRGFTNIGAVNSNRPFVNGNREQTNNFTVDGLDVNETVDNRVSYQPSPDAIAEISVETNNYAADVGNVGGASISSVIKSGTNKFRGNAFEFYRNSDFDANTWENNRSSAKKQERKQHIYGGTLGGPIASNSLFFFADYQGSRQDAPGEALASVAPEAWRRGDLSSISAQLRDPVTGVPFAGNQIPVERFSATARAILNDTANYPLPNRTVPGGIINNYVGNTVLAIRAHQGDARLDWSQSANNKFFGRYSFARYNDKRDVQPFPLVLTYRQRPAVRQRRFQLEPRVWIIDGERSAGRFQQHARHQQHCGLGRHRRRQRTLRHCRGTTDRGFEPDRMGYSVSPCPGAIAPDSDTLARTYQINEKLTWLRGRHGSQVRRADAALQPAPILCRQQRAARVDYVQRHVHGKLPSPTSCSTRSTPRDAAAATLTIRGRIFRTASRYLRRTTSRSRRT